ncbi:MAG: META domain-containing protein, partial [Acidobacteriota bacterium]|nr:META domain-containing protein [Acidobacteriota bacterium]
AVVLLLENSGGSGDFLYLGVVALDGEDAVNAATIAVGDRPQVRAFDLEGSWIRLDVVEQGPEDPACCPSRLAARFWRLDDDGLVEVATNVRGTLSLAELAGGVWTLASLGPDEPLPEDVEITIAFEDGKVTGRSGCNSYFAGIEETSPGRVELGPAGATRKACPPPLMDVEQRYLTRLGGVTRYQFLLGKLALAWRIERESGMLLYERSPGPEVTDKSP